MTLKQTLQEYIVSRDTDSPKTALELIRTISGVFNPDSAVDLLVLVNQVTRLECGDLDIETFKSVWGLE